MSHPAKPCYSCDAEGWAYNQVGQEFSTITYFLVIQTVVRRTRNYPSTTKKVQSTLVEAKMTSIPPSLYHYLLCIFRFAE
uniref:Uncharacterized protein n=1 Tax=Rhizophora mucronata TaxID=61149 RepID=A0A2P2Q4P9_RHIMU